MAFRPVVRTPATPEILEVDLDVFHARNSIFFRNPRDIDFAWLLLRLPLPTETDDVDPFVLSDTQEQNIPGKYTSLLFYFCMSVRLYVISFFKELMLVQGCTGPHNQGHTNNNKIKM